MTPWIKRLILANIAVFILELQFPQLEAMFALSRYSLFYAPWTLITYMFTHHGFEHILWNMLGLFFLGPRVEVRLGGPRFLGLYFVGGLAGGALSLALSPVAIVGASASIFAVYLAYAMFWPRDRLLIWGLIPVPAIVLVAGLTAISILGGGGYIEPGVAHWAHLGGFAGGYIYLTFLKHQTGSQKFRAKAAPVKPMPKSPEVLAKWRRIDPASLHPVNREELTRILIKLDTGGPSSLTSDERNFLDRFAGA
ncbi:MAG TPA: rhomboid family intramembrane serine protease [Gemmatimonadales bacterium]|nr:rhomboid family intramembrane serine protease [Gemmatimonadales bacterium]